MARDWSSVGRSFPTTRWTLLDTGPAAVAAFFERYRPALKSHLLQVKRIDPHDADDLIQGFVTTQMIEQDLLSRADAGQGRFRTFLLTALDRYVVSEYRRRNAHKRHPPGRAILNIDKQPAVPPPADEPSDVFDVAWARQIIREATERMRRECESSGSIDEWNIFEFRFLGPMLDQLPAPSYAQLIRRFQLQSPAQASNLLITAKRRFARAIRAVIAEYAHSSEQIEQEIADLMQVLAKARLPVD